MFIAYIQVVINKIKTITFRMKIKNKKLLRHHLQTVLFLSIYILAQPLRKIKKSHEISS